MIIDFVMRLLQLAGIVTVIIAAMLVVSVKSQDQWKIMREQARSSGWRKAITNELEWRKFRRLRARAKYEYEPEEPPT